VKLIFAMALLVVGCTKQQVAKDEYSAQSHACVDIYSGNSAAQKSCLEYVRKKWDSAGAPPAAVTDGGPSQ